MEHRTTVGWAVALTGFWLALAGTVRLQAVVAGLTGAVLVVAMNRRALVSLREFPGRGLAAVRLWAEYVLRFAWELLRANLQVAAIVLSPRLAISPRVVRFPGRLRTDAARVILSNTITLTPGTLTIDVDETTFTVHALTSTAAEGVQHWIMEDLLCRLEEQAAGERGPKHAAD